MNFLKLQCFLLLLNCCTVYSASLPRSKRTPSPVEQGNDWFKSFYSMFSEDGRGYSYSTVEDPKVSSLEEALQNLKNRDESSIPSLIPTPTPYSPKPSRTEAPITPAPKPGSLSIQDFFPSVPSQPNVKIGETPKPSASSSQKYPSQVPQPFPYQQNQDPQSYKNQQYPTQDQNPSSNQQYPSPGQLPQSYPNQQSQLPQPSANQQIPTQSYLPKPSTNQQYPSQSQVPKPSPNQENPSQGQMPQPFPNQQNPSQGQMPQPFPNQQNPSQGQMPQPFPYQQYHSQGQLPQSSTYQQNPSQGQVPQPYPNQYYQPNNYQRGDYASSSQNHSQEFGDNSLIPNKKPSSGFPNKDPSQGISFPAPSGYSFDAPLFQLPKEECHTDAGEIGECLAPFNCGAEGGEPAGLCHQGLDAAHHIRSCCIFPSYCGYETNKEVSYLTNPDYPKSTTLQKEDCIFKVDLLPGVCQLRLDFLEFEMKPMERGICEDKNSLIISSTEKTAMIPQKQLCGTIHSDSDLVDPLRTDIPHMYVNIDRDPPFTQGQPSNKIPNKIQAPSVKMNLKVTDFPSRWNIRISQILCDGANLQAPMGCSQYYNMNSGNISSLNIKDGQYPQNLRWSSCIKRDPMACAVEYNLRKFSLGETKAGPGRLGYGLTCQDYLVINGEKTALCGGLNQPRPLIFPASGPESIFFYSDNIFTKADVGYIIEYKHHLNCTGLTHYSYPSKK
ncbi:uncharacterized protein LOC111708127 [Eurytemora carolleeae]|uniref:uncharacterized protein LOC111708127 n=1 Tax=Eurytemora carolleeae TaxID=1294199 RepID=UPI000C75C1F7|nr:uncharacterized protein LOC111708127 [Eurytemora carolleeae]|eukprot:XP_023337168.1 uncharacterized protein LOC111708127 [Eurytemora affinis]